MARSLDDLARELHALEDVDQSDFRRRARVLQSLWRQERGYPCGEHRGRQLGSRLPMPWAKESLANFLSENTKAVVRSEVLDAAKGAGKLYGQPRIFNDLLSSQPLAFNLFAELKTDLVLASAVVEQMTAGRFSEVTAIELEHSPGRGDVRYTGDRSAFDAFVECRTRTGGAGFLGIEVKYHENLVGEPAEHRARYDEVAASMGCFDNAASERLRAQPLQQIWRDHLLAGALRDVHEYHDAAFAVLYPAGNTHCVQAIAAYRTCLTSDETLLVWTLEELAKVIRGRTQGQWIVDFTDRYLAFEKVDRLLAGAMPDTRVFGA